MEADNKFAVVLQEQFNDVLDHAISNSYIVCIPTSSALADKELTRRFISEVYSVDHMLKPSPYVEGLFQSLSGRNVLIKTDEISTHTGYLNKFSVRILAEENSHDSKGQVYKRVLISAALDDSAKRVDLVPAEPIYKFYRSKEYIGFLNCAVENSEAAVMYADAFVTSFNNSYIIFKEFATNCYEKVKTALHDVFEVGSRQICKNIPQFAAVGQDAKYSAYLVELVESNVLDKVYDKLFTNMIHFHEEEQAEFEAQASRVLEVSSAAEIGVDRDLASLDFAKSMQHISELERLRTPWEKLHVLTQLPNVMCKEVKAYLRKVNYDRAEHWEMSADQYFPLCTWFLAKLHPQHILAHLTFMSEFSLSSAKASQERYHLTNMLAAVQTIRHLAQNVQPPPPANVVEWPKHFGRHKTRTTATAISMESDSD
jgi:hypothetical protein